MINFDTLSIKVGIPVLEIDKNGIPQNYPLQNITGNNAHKISTQELSHWQQILNKIAENEFKKTLKKQLLDSLEVEVSNLAVDKIYKIIYEEIKTLAKYDKTNIADDSTIPKFSKQNALLILKHL